MFGVEMAFLQYNLPGSSITGDVSEPAGNYHNKNSIHELTAAPNFLLPFASKSHSHDAGIRTIAQEEVKGELRKQGLTSLGDGISTTPAGRALPGCGSTQTPLAIPAAGTGATALLALPGNAPPAGSWGAELRAARVRSKQGQGSKPGLCPDPQEPPVGAAGLLPPPGCSCSCCSWSQGMAWGGKAAVLSPNPCHSVSTE